MKYNAYWISPSGAQIPVKVTHIDTIFKHPTKFGLTKDKIKKVYDKHKEPFAPFEGFAREEIIADLMKKGWIRLRYVPRPDEWTIQVAKLDNKRKDFIFDWADKMTQSKESPKHTGVRIVPNLTGAGEYYGDMEDILKFTIFEVYKLPLPKLRSKTYIVELAKFKPKPSDKMGNLILE